MIKSTAIEPPRWIRVGTAILCDPILMCYSSVQWVVWSVKCAVGVNGTQWGLMGHNGLNCSLTPCPLCLVWFVTPYSQYIYPKELHSNTISKVKSPGPFSFPFPFFLCWPSLLWHFNHLTSCTIPWPLIVFNLTQFLTPWPSRTRHVIAWEDRSQLCQKKVLERSLLTTLVSISTEQLSNGC